METLGSRVTHDVEAGLSEDDGVLLGVVRHERDRVVKDVDVFRVSGRRGVAMERRRAGYVAVGVTSRA